MDSSNIFNCRDFLNVPFVSIINVFVFFPPGLQIPEVKTEVPVDLDIFSCLDAFTLVLGSNRDIIFVSENVSNYIGLSQVKGLTTSTKIWFRDVKVELLGQDLADYVHPSDQQQLEKLLMKTQAGTEDEAVQVPVQPVHPSPLPPPLL